MPKTPSKIDMYDMMKIDTIVFDIGWGGGLYLKHPGLDRVKIIFVKTYVCGGSYCLSFRTKFEKYFFCVFP